MRLKASVSFSVIEICPFSSTFNFGASSTTAAAPAGGAFTFGAQPKGDQ